MRILVTGCAGFLGYHFSRRLLDEQHDVVGLDNLSTGSSANAALLSQNPRFRFISHDITAPLPVEGPFDMVCNLACPASPIDFDTMALDILAVCSQGVRNLLEFSRQCGARFFHTSTSEVYGDPLEHPQKETYWGNVNPCGPRSCYDEGKRFAEALIAAFHRTHGLETRVARIFNTYGPHMRPHDGRALPSFISQALRGEPLTVHGDGSQTRSFCFVSDLIDGLWRLAQSDVRDPVNIGNPVEVSIRHVAEEVIRLCGSRSQVRLTARPPDDPHVRCPDITRAKTLLGWSPRVPREEGFGRTVAWFREQMGK